MIRLPRLQQPPARLFAAPRAPRHLLQQLKRPLRRARIGRRKPDIRIDHADQRQMRKIMALRHELRADDDVVGARRDILEFAPQPLDAAGMIGR